MLLHGGVSCARKVNDACTHLKTHGMFRAPRVQRLAMQLSASQNHPFEHFDGVSRECRVFCFFSFVKRCWSMRLGL